MADVNHVILIGRCSRDAVLTYTSGGMAIANLALAVNRRVKKGEQWTEEVSFFEVTLWGKTAEGLSKYLLKGKQVAVEGELRQDRWQQDGQPRSKVVISASNIQLLGGNDKQGGQQKQDAGYQADYSADNFVSEIPF